MASPQAFSSDEEQEDNVVVRVGLTVYEWHTLLRELEHSMSIVNRDTTNAKQLWEKIANKLNGSIS